MLEQILERYDEDEFLIADGFDEAIIGVSEDFNAPLRLIYSVTKCLEILRERDGMGDTEALEHFYINVSGGYVGDKTPVWCWDDFE